MIDKFYSDELDQALKSYKNNGVVIFKDLVPENLIKSQSLQINKLISNQFAKVFKNNTKTLNVDKSFKAAKKLSVLFSLKKCIFSEKGRLL